MYLKLGIKIKIAYKFHKYDLKRLIFAVIFGFKLFFFLNEGKFEWKCSCEWEGKHTKKQTWQWFFKYFSTIRRYFRFFCLLILAFFFVLNKLLIVTYKYFIKTLWDVYVRVRISLHFPRFPLLTIFSVSFFHLTLPAIFFFFLIRNIK